MSTHRSLAVAIVVGSLMHAAGHAGLAAAGGVLARALAGGGAIASATATGGSVAILSKLTGRDPVISLASIGLLAAFAKLVGGVAAAWGEARVAGEVGSELRLEVLERVIGVHALTAPRHGDHGSTQVHGLASLTSHVKDVEAGVSRGVLAEIRAVVQLAPLALLLVVLAPSLAGSAALALAAFGALVLVARRALKRGHANAAREAEALLGAADEAVKHADVWITYGAQRRVRERVVSLSRAAIETAARLRARAAMLSGTSEVLGALALVLVLALAGAGAGATAGVERGALVPFAIAFFMAYKPLRELVEGRIATGRAQEALEEASGSRLQAPGSRREEEEQEEEEEKRSSWGRGELVVEGLVAAHGEHAAVSMRVPFGKVAAIVGPTGCGKTSLLRAMLGLESERAGSVGYDGISLDGRGPGPKARPFAWVPQDAPVVAGTLGDNVGFGALDDEEVSAIVARVGGEALVTSAKDATLATDRPVSGGERQWIAVARALATDLPVLLFDEPTSALDGDAQERMLHAIAALRGTRTVIVVTHRPEPLALADVVVRIDARSITAA